MDYHDTRRWERHRRIEEPKVTTYEDLRNTTMAQAQGAMALQIAFVGIANGLLDALEERSDVAPELARRLMLDAGYVTRWCEAAYGFGYLDLGDQGYALTELGRAFLPGAPETLMPFAVQSVLGAHMTEHAAGLMRTGERPGESALAE
jgi:hypothetical protein